MNAASKNILPTLNKYNLRVRKKNLGGIGFVSGWLGRFNDSVRDLGMKKWITMGRENDGDYK